MKQKKTRQDYKEARRQLRELLQRKKVKRDIKEQQDSKMIKGIITNTTATRKNRRVIENKY